MLTGTRSSSVGYSLLLKEEKMIKVRALAVPPANLCSACILHCPLRSALTALAGMGVTSRDATQRECITPCQGIARLLESCAG